MTNGFLRYLYIRESAGKYSCLSADGVVIWDGYGLVSVFRFQVARSGHGLIWDVFPGNPGPVNDVANMD